MKLRFLAACLAACLAALAAAGSAYAQTKTLRLAHWIPPTHPVHDAVKAWAGSLEKASNGSLAVQIFPASQLGAAKDHYDLAKNGLADITWINMGYEPGRFPVSDLADIPFNFGQADTRTASAVLNDWFAPYAAKEMADVAVCFVHVGPAGTLHSKKPVTKPDDVKGLKVRPASGAVSQYIGALGGSAVPVAAPEARSALERGIADAITFPAGSLIQFGIDKAVTHHLDMRMYLVGAAMVMNKSMVQSLSAPQKAALDAHCNTDWATRFAADWAAIEDQGMAKLAATPGHVVHKPSAAELAAFAAVAKPQQERWAAAVTKAGHDAAAVSASFDAALRRRGVAR